MAQPRLRDAAARARRDPDAPRRAPGRPAGHVGGRRDRRRRDPHRPDRGPPGGPGVGDAARVGDLRGREGRARPPASSSRRSAGCCCSSPAASCCCCPRARAPRTTSATRSDPGFERLPTPNFEQGRGGERPRGVVLHTTAGTFAGDRGVVRPAARAASARTTSSASTAASRRLVREEDTARHAGRVRDPVTPLATGDPNRHTIGIEFEDGGDPEGVDRPVAQYRQGARLLRTIAARWAIPLDPEHVVGHREIFAAKACPGNLDVERLLARGAADAPGLPAAGAQRRARPAGVARLGVAVRRRGRRARRRVDRRDAGAARGPSARSARTHRAPPPECRRLARRPQPRPRPRRRPSGS